MAFVYSLLLISVTFSLVTAELVLEEGYVVTTVIDGHKLRINPHTAHARSGSFDLVILDSKASSFYSASLPLSEETVVKRLAGDGVAGYHDGELGQARFKMPRSFVVDGKGNIYVADKNNNAIRKISLSGTVTTIAGGISKEEGRKDGPAQNATFSNDFELTFVPRGCYLLVSDHGNQLIRQIYLKEEDCARTSHSTLGTASVWVIGLLVSCLLGIVFGIAIRPYVIRNEGWTLLLFLETWKLYLISLAKQAPILFFAIRNEAARFETIDLLKSGSSEMIAETVYDDLNDLISFEDTSELLNVGNGEINKEAKTGRSDGLLSNPEEKIDRMIQTHINGFGKVAEDNLIRAGSSTGCSVLVKRRCR